MKRKARFAAVTLFILLTRSYDAYCTYQHTPNLSKEANPLVSVLGLGWAPLLVVLGALMVYVIYAYYQRTFRTKNLLPSEEGYTFSNIIAYTYLGSKQPWCAVFYKLPDSFSRFTQYMGHTLTPCLVYAGMVSTIMWQLIHHSAYYKAIHSPALVYSILLVGCLIILYRFNKKMYGRYLAYLHGKNSNQPLE